MPSDAYMELQDPDVWGETLDAEFGEGGRNLGAFEIFNFDLSATSNREEGDSKGGLGGLAAALAALGGHGGRGAQGGHGHGAAGLAGLGGAGGRVGASMGGAAAASHTEPVVKQFNVSKYIDKASPDLFLACCKKKKIEWGIITIRETGEFTDDKSKRKPYLVIEFTNLYVDQFGWTINPGAEAEGASQEEKVTFSFETILIKYSRQQKTGEHTRVKIKGFNRMQPDQPVTELGWNRVGLSPEDY